MKKKKRKDLGVGFVWLPFINTCWWMKDELHFHKVVTSLVAVGSSK